MTQLTGLKSATSLTDVAHLLGYKPAALSYILYKIPARSKYTTFEIDKRYGGVRKISAPAPQLKILQRRLCDLLQNCSEEINETCALNDHLSHGFKRRRSIITNAKPHRNHRYVFNIDLQDFFGSINFGRIRGFFISDRNFALDPAVATVVAQIAVDNDALPQGSPCSPVISNLIGHILDIHLVRLASKSGCRYSRYADDLTFSTNERNFPECIARRENDSVHEWIPGKELSRIVEKSGFWINPSKTRMQYRDSRQDVTGLVVNEKINVRREYRHTVRAMVHRLITVGVFEIIYKKMRSDGSKVENRAPGALDQLHGMLGFINSIDLFNRELRAKNGRIQAKPYREELTYLRFLLYKLFYVSESPVIVCEGQTDNVYMLHAIRSLALSFPNLATKNSDGTISLKVRIFKYAGTSTGRILGLTGGASCLGHLIRIYRNNVDRFKAPGLQNPVLLLVDNDTGAKPVYNAVKQVTGVKPTGTESFVHIKLNMYLVPIPTPKHKTESAIEDLFDPKLLTTKVDGKTFHASDSGFDSSIHYGKTVFAHKIVRPNADSIDFSGFSDLLTNLSEVIDDHATKFSSSSF